MMRADVYRVELPLASPLRFGDITLRSRTSWLLRASVGELEGWGEAAPLPAFGGGHGEGMRVRLETLAEAWLAGGAPIPTTLQDTETILRACGSRAPSLRADSMVLGALDGALTSLGIQASGAAPSTWFNGTMAPVDGIQVNGLIGGGFDELNIIEAGRSLVSQGFRTAKVKVGVTKFEDELRALMALRDALPELTLRLDANGRFNASTVDDRLRRLATVEPEYLEQPLAADQVEAFASLAGRSPVPLAADESLLLGEDAWEVLVDSEAVSAVVLKPGALGGPTRTWRLACRARLRGASVTVTTFLDSAVGRRHAANVAAALGLGVHGLATGSIFTADVARDVVKEGRLMLGDWGDVESAPGVVGDEILLRGDR